MTCYKDRTFCPYGILCKDSPNCDRILSEEAKSTLELYEKIDLPVCYYAEFPDCFVPFFLAEQPNNGIL